MKNRIHSGNGLLPYPIIEAASKGDVDALNIVLKHYGRYINSLCIRTYYDSDGISHNCIDEEMRRRLEMKLITNIMSFRAA